MRRRNGFPALVGPGEQDGENGARARRAAAAYARAPGFLSVFLSWSRRTSPSLRGPNLRGRQERGKRRRVNLPVEPGMHMLFARYW
jgi:hypothetical protein